MRSFSLRLLSCFKNETDYDLLCMTPESMVCALNNCLPRIGAPIGLFVTLGKFLERVLSVPHRLCRIFVTLVVTGEPPFSIVDFHSEFLLTCDVVYFSFVCHRGRPESQLGFCSSSFRT